MPEPDADMIEPEAFLLLQTYLEELHAGRRPDRNQFLAAHPELTSALDCLDAVDSLALRHGVPNEFDSLIHLTPTQVWPGRPDGSRGASGPAPVAPEVTGDFGDYELLAEIGRGGMGVVYKARQKSLDRFVAIKMILTNHLASEDQVRRFYAEAKAAARLRHENIVGVHDAGQLYGQHYIVMEYVEGESLADLLKEGPMPPEAAGACIGAIARAVHHLHLQGIVHRDLKPLNILLDKAGKPYVSDFGLAKMLAADSQTTSAGAIIGTPSYMAPEQAGGRARIVGPLSDVYSLGAILYELLTGRPPFRGETPLDTLVQVLEGEPSLPRELIPTVPRDLEMICMRCLEKAPEARYASAAAVADDIERFLKGDLVEARPPGLWQRLRRWSRREPALTARLGILSLCFLAEWASYQTGVVKLMYFLRITLILAVWATVSVVYQQLLKKDRWADLTRFVWAGTDALLITAVLIVARGIEGPLVITYPGLVAASGLWFRHRLVWFVTAVSVASYLGLMIYWQVAGPGLHEPLYRHAISVFVLVVLGSVVAYQVKRIRALSRYYENRRFP